MRPRSGRRLDSRGAVLVEAALVTPVVILVMMAIVDGGMLMLTLLSTDEVVGDGSRSAIVLRDDQDCLNTILDRICVVNKEYRHSVPGFGTQHI